MFGSGGVLFNKDHTLKKLVWVAGDVVYASVTMPINYRVLEIGSGQDPHPGADVIVDKFTEDNHHRMGGYELIKELQVVTVDNDGNESMGTSRPDFVQADITDLPFEANSFDFVITKHILEHVDDLELAVNEINRVGKAGYIECPKMESEMLFPQGEIHRWVFDDSKGYPRARSVVGLKSPFGRTMHKLFVDVPEFKAAWGKAYHYFHMTYFWQGRLYVETDRSPVEEVELFNETTVS